MKSIITVDIKESDLLEQVRAQFAEQATDTVEQADVAQVTETPAAQVEESNTQEDVATEETVQTTDETTTEEVK